MFGPFVRNESVVNELVTCTAASYIAAFIYLGCNNMQCTIVMTRTFGKVEAEIIMQSSSNLSKRLGTKLL